MPAAVNFTQASGVALSAVSSAINKGHLGEVFGIDIVITYANWPREWQKAADWPRFRVEGGITREVISHFLFFCRANTRTTSPHLVLTFISYRQSPLRNSHACPSRAKRRLTCNSDG